MMSTRLLVVNMLVLAVSGTSVAYVAQVVTEPTVRPIVRARPTAPAPAASSDTPAPPPTAAAGGPAAYAVVASKNLFSPTRTETPPAAVAVQPPRPVAPPVKPSVFGIVLREGTPIAYIEDPATKRVAGYRPGDSLAGGTIEAIRAESVVLARPDGAMELQLRDPSKPRPPAPAVAAGQAPRPQAGAVPGAAPGGVTPGVVAPGLGMPGAPAAGGALIPPTTARRPLPPNLLRRLPPTSSDAPQQ